MHLVGFIIRNMHVSASAKLALFCTRYRTQNPTNCKKSPFNIIDAKYTVDPAYNDNGLYDTLSITSDIMWYQLIPYC